MTAAERDRRLKILLPPEYEDRDEQVPPTSMRSAGLRYDPDGLVAWNTIWGSFCDLAMAGGPPHRGTLLAPGRPHDVQQEPARYQEVVAEIRRGIRLLTNLEADAAPVPGWVRMDCRNEAMAGWLARAIIIENVSVYVQGSVVCLPAAPSFRVEKEIKNVLAAVAKTTHYWVGHASPYRHWEVGRLLMAMDRESQLLQPPLQAREDTASSETTSAIAAAVESSTGRRCSSGKDPSWIAINCPSIPTAVHTMRSLLVHNILARREENRVFAPHNALSDPDGKLLTAGVAAALQLSTTAHLHPTEPSNQD